MLIPGLATVSVLMLMLQQGAIGGVVVSAPDAPPQTRTPPRDQRMVQRTGTGAIRGRVVDGLNGQPLVHTQVRLTGTNPPKFVTTDASGAFAFANLPIGRYQIVVIKSGYLTTTFPESTRTVRSIGNGLTLADGQTIDRVTVPMYRGGAITGRIVDAWGDPLESTEVRAVRAPGSRAGRSLGGGPSSGSNDAGEFRVGRLEPGAYLIVATPRGPRGGGGDGDFEATSPVPTYYPGVLSPSEAQPVVVERGQVMSGIDFQVLEQNVTTIAGAVLDPEGQLAGGGNIQVQTWGVGMTSTRWATQIRPDGTFELKLPPGDYRLIANLLTNDEIRRISAQSMNFMRTMSGSRDVQPSGMVRLTVGGEPLANVVIAAGIGGSISGRVTFEGDAPPPDPTRITIMAETRRLYTPGGATTDTGEECRSSGEGKTANADLTFTLENIRGACILAVNIAGGGGARWRVKSAIYHDADLVDRPIDLGSNQNVRDVQIVVTSRPTALSADVTDDQGASTQDYVLLAFSTDKTRWPLQRYVSFASSSVPRTLGATATSTPTAPSTATPASTPTPMMPTRSVTVNYLPAGEYYAVAIDDVAFDEVHDPAFLDQLVASATRVTLREGEPQKLQLRRIKRPTSDQ